MHAEIDRDTVQIVRDRGLCYLDGLAVPDAVRSSAAGQRAWDGLAAHQYGETVSLARMAAAAAEVERQRAIIAARNSAPAILRGSPMLCAGCGDAVPCVQMRIGYMCLDCRLGM